MWARDVSDISATHAGLVHDVIDTRCWAQNGSAHGRVFHKSEEKSSGKTAVRLF